MSDVRLIDANAADVERICCYYGDNCRIEDVQEWLDDQPTIDAVPVAQGRLEGDHWDYKCSACGTAFHDDILWIQGDRIVPKYCPECGVRWTEVVNE